MAKEEKLLNNLTINIFDDVETFNAIEEPSEDELYFVPTQGLHFIGDDGAVYRIGVGTTDDGETAMYFEGVE